MSGQIIYLPRSKLVYCVDDTFTDNPDGLGLFRHLVEPSHRQTRYLQLEGWGYETDLRGVPVGRAPLTELSKMVDKKTITPTQRATIVAAISNFIQNHIRNPESGLLLDSETFRALDAANTPTNIAKWSMELMQAGQTSLPDLDKAIQRLNHDMARLLGIENLLLGSDGSGSLALSEDKTNSLFLTVDSAMDDLQEAAQKDIVDTIWRLNGLDEDLKPWLKPATTQFKDVEKMTAALRNLATAGAVLSPNDPAIGEIRDIMGLPRPDPADVAAMMEDAALTAAEELGDSADDADTLEGKTSDDGEQDDPKDERVGAS